MAKNIIILNGSARVQKEIHLHSQLNLRRVQKKLGTKLQSFSYPE